MKENFKIGFPFEDNESIPSCFVSWEENGITYTIDTTKDKDPIELYKCLDGCWSKSNDYSRADVEDVFEFFKQHKTLEFCKQIALRKYSIAEIIDRSHFFTTQHPNLQKTSNPRRISYEIKEWLKRRI